MDDFGKTLPFVVKKVGVPIEYIGFAGLLGIVVVVLIQVLKQKDILMAKKEELSDGNQLAPTLSLEGRIVFQTQLERICSISLICQRFFGFLP